MITNRLAVCLVLSTATVPFIAPAQLSAAPGDWPGWRGPDRTGVSTETGLLREWPKGGPPLLWKATGLGGGYSTPSVAGGRLFVMGSQGGTEYLLAFDIKNGQKLWSTKVGPIGENYGPNYPGPRSTPTVDGDRLYTLGSDGDLVCADTQRGEIRWRRHLEKDFGGLRGTWAYAESPLIDGPALICTPGGPTATLVALDKTNGKVLWKTKGPEYNGADYASVVVTRAAGVKQYVQFLGTGVVGVRAKDGELLWWYRGNVGGFSAMTPIVYDGCVFTSSGGNQGAGGDALLRLTADGGGVTAKQVYLVRNMLSSHGGAVRLGDHLYGTGRGGLVCLDFRTGAVKWRDRSVGSGSLMAADGRLYLRGTQGDMVLVEATPTGCKELGRFRQPHRSRFHTFAHPVVAGGRLYLRDEDVLLCYNIAAK